MGAKRLRLRHDLIEAVEGEAGLHEGLALAIPEEDHGRSEILAQGQDVFFYFS